MVAYLVGILPAAIVERQVQGQDVAARRQLFHRSRVRNSRLGSVRRGEGRAPSDDVEPKGAGT